MAEGSNRLHAGSQAFERLFIYLREPNLLEIGQASPNAGHGIIRIDLYHDALNRWTIVARGRKVGAPFDHQFAYFEDCDGIPKEIIIAAQKMEVDGCEAVTWWAAVTGRNSLAEILAKIGARLIIDFAADKEMFQGCESVQILPEEDRIFLVQQHDRQVGDDPREDLVHRPHAEPRILCLLAKVNGLHALSLPNSVEAFGHAAEHDDVLSAVDPWLSEELLPTCDGTRRKVAEEAEDPLEQLIGQALDGRDHDREQSWCEREDWKEGKRRSVKEKRRKVREMRGKARS